MNLVSAGTLDGVTPAASAARAERVFGLGVRAAAVAAALVLLCSASIAFWSQNELAPPESVVAAHSLMLAQHGTLYYDLNQYPYTVSAYMPVFYALEAGLIRLGLPAFAGGRLLSLAALLGLVFVTSRIVQLYTGHLTSARIAAVAVAISPLMLFWGVVAQVDMLAVFLTVAAFHQFARYDVLGEPVLLRAGLLAGLALFTKQTMLAAPAAMLLVLAIRDWKQALRFALGLGVPLAAAVGAADLAVSGRFLQNTLFANMNPMDGEKLLAQLQYFGGVCGGLLVIALAALPKFRGKALAPAVYLACSAAVFLGTAPKIGSDTNYQLELCVTLVLCAAIGLHLLDFYRLHFAGSKSWITLLILPLGVHAAVGLRMAWNMLPMRVANEQVFRAEVESLRPYVPSGGKVVSTDYNAMVRLRQRMDVEPLIYGLLVQAGRVNPEPLRRDLAEGRIPTVILHQDISKSEAANAEIGSLPEVQLAELREHYRMAAHIPGPFLDGVFVYLPLSGHSTGQSK